MAGNNRLLRFFYQFRMVTFWLVERLSGLFAVRTLFVTFLVGEKSSNVQFLQ
jgi:hypothetical protein